jgi:hypothetical protein
MGIPTRRELLSRMTSREYAELKAFFNLEPFGEAREDYRQAIAATAIARAHGAKVEVADMIPGYTHEQSAEEMFESLITANPNGNHQRSKHQPHNGHPPASDGCL